MSIVDSVSRASLVTSLPVEFTDASSILTETTKRKPTISVFRQRVKNKDLVGTYVWIHGRLTFSILFYIENAKWHNFPVQEFASSGGKVIPLNTKNTPTLKITRFETRRSPQTGLLHPPWSRQWSVWRQERMSFDYQNYSTGRGKFKKGEWVNDACAIWHYLIIDLITRKLLVPYWVISYSQSRLISYLR